VPVNFSQQIYAFTPAPPAERLFWAFPRFSVAKLLAQYGQRRNPSNGCPISGAIAETDRRSPARNLLTQYN
jgi:hypothetical protein